MFDLPLSEFNERLAGIIQDIWSLLADNPKSGNRSKSPSSSSSSGYSSSTSSDDDSTHKPSDADDYPYEQTSSLGSSS